MHKIKVLLVTIFLVCSTNCAGLMQGIVTTLDIATCLCKLVATEQPKDELMGMTPEEWCAVKENVQPFVEQIVKAKNAASKNAGFSRAVAD